MRKKKDRKEEVMTNKEQQLVILVESKEREYALERRRFDREDDKRRTVRQTSAVPVSFRVRPASSDLHGRVDVEKVVSESKKVAYGQYYWTGTLLFNTPHTSKNLTTEQRTDIGRALLSSR